MIATGGPARESASDGDSGAPGLAAEEPESLVPSPDIEDLGALVDVVRRKIEAQGGTPAGGQDIGPPKHEPGLQAGLESGETESTA